MQKFEFEKKKKGDDFISFERQPLIKGSGLTTKRFVIDTGLKL